MRSNLSGCLISIYYLQILDKNDVIWIFPLVKSVTSILNLPCRIGAARFILKEVPIVRVRDKCNVKYWPFLRIYL